MCINMSRIRSLSKLKTNISNNASAHIVDLYKSKVHIQIGGTLQPKYISIGAE
jgi:hypothetical protein